MGQVLVDVLFFILNTISNFILSPIISAVVSVIPALGSFFQAFFTVASYFANFLGFLLDLFMIPRWIFTSVILMGFGILAFNTTVRVVGLAMAVYKWFKP